MTDPAPAPCPVCGGRARADLSGLGGWTVDRCEVCGHRFCRGSFAGEHTRSQFDDAYFSGGTAVGYPDYLAEAPLRRALGRWYARRLARLAPRLGLTCPGTALDIGCAAGFVMQGLADEGWQVVGVDPNARMVAHARERLGLEAFAGDASNLASVAGLRIPEGGFDLLTLIQVVGHLVDPGRAIREAANVLSDRGVLLIETWDSDSRVARAFGRGWHEYSPPNVLQFFTRASLDRLLAEHGFERVLFGRTRKRLSVGHLRNFVGRRYRGSAGRTLNALLGRLPGTWGLPYPGDDLFHAGYMRRAAS